MSWSGGDWMCSACQHQNFRKREVCQRCGYPKFDGPDPAGWTRILPGDWYCSSTSCGVQNYASRTSCFKCGAFRIDYSATACGSQACNFPPGWKAGDWICPRMGCGEHNYASRTECHRCRTPKNFGDAVHC